MKLFRKPSTLNNRLLIGGKQVVIHYYTGYRAGASSFISIRGYTLGSRINMQRNTIKPILHKDLVSFPLRT